MNQKPNHFFKTESIVNRIPLSTKIKKLCIIFIFFLFSFSANAAYRVGVFDFAISSVSDYRHLKRALADTLSFLFVEDPSFYSISPKRLASAAGFKRGSDYSLNRMLGASDKLKLDLSITGGLILNKNSIEIIVKAYKKGYSHPSYTFRQKGKSLAEIYDIFDAAHRGIRKNIYGLSSPSLKYSLPVDLLLSIDISGSMNTVYADIKKSIIRLLNSFDIVSPVINPRIALILFKGNRIIKTVKFTIERSKLINTLASQIPYGGNNSPADLSKIFRLSTGKFKWRKNARKFIVYYGNSGVSTLFSAPFVSAKKRGISFICASADGMPSHAAEKLAGLSRYLEGAYLHTDYMVEYYKKGAVTQAFFLKKGKVYRLKKPVSPDLWQSDTASINISPNTRIFSAGRISETMRILKRLGKKRLLIKYVSSNLANKILFSLKKSLSMKSINLKFQRASARALFRSNGKTFWQTIGNRNAYLQLKGKLRSGKFWLGSSVIPASYTAKGMILNPFRIIIPKYQRRIPSLIKVPLHRLADKPLFYHKYGLFPQNIWFIKVKLLKLIPIKGIDFRLEG